MNTNQKKLKLVKEGIKVSTLNKMTNSQINTLFGKLLEQVSTVTEPAKTGYKVGDKGGDLPPTPKGYNVKKNADGSIMATPNEQKEIDEKFEPKKQQKYFFSKCGDGKTKEQKKWCKMADEFAKKTNFAKIPEKKKETKENFDFGGYNKKIASVASNLHQKNLSQASVPDVKFANESEIEKQIMRLVEKHITPKMSKKDFETLFEGDTKVAPAKPKVTPGTKPKHPFQPNPSKKGAPKAVKSEVGEGDTKVAPAKPKVTPGTKPKHPFAPDPSKKGAPKAMDKELPSFLKFNQLGLNIK